MKISVAPRLLQELIPRTPYLAGGAFAAPGKLTSLPGAGLTDLSFTAGPPLPELLNGIRTALALAFILLVSSELIVAQKGFGYLIGSLGASGSYEAMYAVVFTVAFLGFAADRIYQTIVQRVLIWRR